MIKSYIDNHLKNQKMKKLKLNLQQFEGAEVLTRSQLKKVLGGDGGSGPCPVGYFWCSNRSEDGNCIVERCMNSIQECWDACW